MAALTTLINVDSEMAPKLVYLIAQAIDDSTVSGEFIATCTQLIESSLTEALILKILDHTEDILHYENPSGESGPYTLFNHVLFEYIMQMLKVVSKP